MTDDDRTELTPQDCAQEMFGMLVDTPEIDPYQIKMAFNLGFFKTWMVADIQEEMHCLKALLVSITIAGAFGYANAAKIVPHFQSLISAAARRKPLYARVEKNFPDYWMVIEQFLDRSWNGNPATFPLVAVATPLGEVFAKHCRLKEAQEAISWVSNIVKATLPSAEALSSYKIV